MAETPIVGKDPFANDGEETPDPSRPVDHNYDSESSNFSSQPMFTPLPGFTPTPGGLAASQIGQLGRNNSVKLSPECSRIVYVRNLPYKIISEELYDLFGKYGTIQQIRKGNTTDTRGTAFVVFDDVHDAKNAVDHLSGFNVAGRYLIVLYYNPEKIQAKAQRRRQQEEIQKLRKMTGANPMA
eukprot:GHVH01001548.1.p1 GENE.GHVH01001548.1~~GHVH01001548.1.p1  ORF type:complete len:198 (-),score=19.63 GHVH01001548.1:105-653(-)